MNHKFRSSKGFPQGGPVDGQIAGGKFGSILDQQTANRWFKKYNHWWGKYIYLGILRLT